MGLSRFMRRKTRVHVAYIAKATAIPDSYGMPQYGTPTRVNVYHEGGFSMDNLTEAGRSLRDADSFILDACEVIPERDDMFWPPGVDHTDATKGQKVKQVVGIPGFKSSMSHYEVYL